MATFATRDQENLIQGWEAAAAGAKTVGKGGRSLAPKTPGKNAFTPAAPRTNRAPLTSKTTNFKAPTFKTPAPVTGGAGLQKTQRHSASGKKPKLKIHQQSEVIQSAPEVQEADEEPEIEYCPAPVKELTDHPDADEILFHPGYDFTWARQCLNQSVLDVEEIGEDGLTRQERERKQNNEVAEAFIDASILEGIEQSMQPEDRTSEFLDRKKQADQRAKELNQRYFNGRLASEANIPPKNNPQKPNPKTIDAKTAAKALSTKPQPRFAAPTVAARARQAGSYAAEKDAPIKRNPPQATIASRSTIGYSTGRQVSLTLRANNGPNASKVTESTTKASPTKTPSDQVRREELMNSLFPSTNADEDTSTIPWSEGENHIDDWFEEQMSNFRLSLPDGVEDDGEDARVTV